MELSYLLFTGSLSGLVSILAHSLVWSVVELFRGRQPHVLERQVQIAEAFLHMLFGITLGFVFWLSWGLAGLVNVLWWVRGLTFGGLALAALSPLLLNIFVTGRMRGLWMLYAIRWLTTCLIVGLGCAWTWQRAA